MSNLRRPRILIELRGGTVESVLSDAEVHIVTIDWDSKSDHAVGIVVAGADTTLKPEAFDAALGAVLAKVGALAKGA